MEKLILVIGVVLFVAIIFKNLNRHKEPFD